MHLTLFFFIYEIYVVASDSCHNKVSPNCYGQQNSTEELSVSLHLNCDLNLCLVSSLLAVMYVQNESSIRRLQLSMFDISPKFKQYNMLVRWMCRIYVEQTAISRKPYFSPSIRKTATERHLFQMEAYGQYALSSRSKVMISTNKSKITLVGRNDFKYWKNYSLKLVWAKHSQKMASMR